MENKNYPKAVKEYSDALKMTKDKKQKAIIWAELSWTFFYQNKYEKAIEAAHNILELNPQYEAPEDAYKVLGFSCSFLQRDNEAIEYLSKSAAIDSSSEKQQTVLFELAKLYFKSQKYARAEEIIKEIEPYFYQNQKDYWLSLLFYKGFIYYYQNDLPKSENIFEELLENAHDGNRKATALFGLAFINFSKKEYLKTINLCEAIIGNDEHFFDTETVGFLTAASFFNLGRKDVFEKYYNQLTKNFPNGHYGKELEHMKNSIIN